uniref:LTR retrotransposon like protein putative n=1 Tax=Albugo laibachii Nc14 TaxID=890382 RepID=F0WHR5_9STRA|nr:LTR retrotransposon like protein putative [Albugo laibachii Nc14]|eukprot:CCA20790.1 LTR retrotransposon like protein putative [Albugo laibachii Nc14]
MSEKQKALEENGTKTDADGGIERIKARLVACGNEQLFGVDYGLTFTAVTELSTVKAAKEEHLENYLAIPQGMDIPANAIEEFGQAGRLWSQLLHAKLEEADFTRCGTDMCLYFLHQNGDVTVVDVYADDLLVTASNPEMVEAFFKSMNVLSMKDLGEVRKFLGMRVNLDNAKPYTLDQRAAIEEMIAQDGLREANGLHC